jgi:hypothetical protein
LVSIGNLRPARWRSGGPAPVTPAPIPPPPFCAEPRNAAPGLSSGGEVLLDVVDQAEEVVGLVSGDVGEVPGEPDGLLFGQRGQGAVFSGHEVAVASGTW